ncbi:MAG: hypothetical protein RLP09_44900 [Sandaracinaceae bacterium]|nr:hypothetical protein [Myxococcales bacterium]
MQSFTRALLVSCSLALAAGCSQNVGEVACEDVITTIGDVAERCGYDRQATEDDFRRLLPVECAEIVELRDADSFYDECLPQLGALTCGEFDDPSFTLPPSCRDQLLYR